MSHFLPTAQAAFFSCKITDEARATVQVGLSRGPRETKTRRALLPLVRIFPEVASENLLWVALPAVLVFAAALAPRLRFLKPPRAPFAIPIVPHDDETSKACRGRKK